MTDLVFLKSKQPVTTSLKVAEQFGKEHKNVLRDIETIIEQMASVSQSSKLGSAQMFAKTTYQAEEGGRRYPMYTMNRDGFALLAMGFTGTKALQFKLRFLAEFNRMERELRELPKPAPLPVIAHVERPLENITDFQRGVVLGKLAAHAQDPYMKKKLIAEAANLIHRDEVFPVTDEERWPF